jgi:hypothetical protein
MIKNKGIINAFKKFIIPCVLQEVFESIATAIPQKFARLQIVTTFFLNNFKCLFFKRLYQIDEI